MISGRLRYFVDCWNAVVQPGAVMPKGANLGTCARDSALTATTPLFLAFFLYTSTKIPLPYVATIASQCDEITV